MIFTTAPYATAAETLILALDSIADRFSPEHDAVLETLSILSTVRDADSFGRPLVGYGERGFVASTGVSIAVFDTLEDARAYIGRAEHRFPRGRAIVEVDRVDGDDPLFTDHELEAPRLEPAGPRRFETQEQVERARELAAYGPLGRRPIDDELDALGWTERYDGDPSSSDLRPHAAAALFDRSGRLAERFEPLEPKPQTALPFVDEVFPPDDPELEGPLYTVDEEVDEETGRIHQRVTTHRLRPADEALARRLGIDPRLVGYSPDGEAWYRGAPLIAYG